MECTEASDKSLDVSCGKRCEVISRSWICELPSVCTQLIEKRSSEEYPPSRRTAIMVAGCALSGRWQGRQPLSCCRRGSIRKPLNEKNQE